MTPGRLTVKEAADLVPTSPSLVYQWVKERRFEVFRVGGRDRRGKILIDEAAFLAFLETLKVGAGGDAPPPAKPVKPQPYRHLNLS